jgi:hypothetical protein
MVFFKHPESLVLKKFQCLLAVSIFMSPVSLIAQTKKVDDYEKFVLTPAEAQQMYSSADLACEGNRANSSDPRNVKITTSCHKVQTKRLR